MTNPFEDDMFPAWDEDDETYDRIERECIEERNPMAFEVKSTKKQNAPVRMTVYGRGGIGKSTLGSRAPDPIFLAAEAGLENIDARAIEPYPHKWEEVLAAIEYIATLSHKTIVVDSLDWLEPVIWEYVCRIANKKNIEAFGYGKGYVAALDQWRVFVHELDKLRAKGMNVVLIAHAVRKLFANPIGDDYDTWTIKLHEKAAGVIVEWCDLVGYCDEDIATVESNGRMKGQSSGRRIIRCNPSPAYLAKTRYELPLKLDLSWKALSEAMRASTVSVEELHAQLADMLAKLGDPKVNEVVNGYLNKQGLTTEALRTAIEKTNITMQERNGKGQATA